MLNIEWGKGSDWQDQGGLLAIAFQLNKRKGMDMKRSAQSIGSKIIRMEAMNMESTDWLNQTDQGVLAEGGDFTDAVQKRCPFFCKIDPIMCDCASIKPLALSDDLD
jgi:hypothetical protein